jgi:hypothetical protein
VILLRSAVGPRANNRRVGSGRIFPARLERSTRSVWGDNHLRNPSRQSDLRESRLHRPSNSRPHTIRDDPIPIDRPEALHAVSSFQAYPTPAVRTRRSARASRHRITLKERGRFALPPRRSGWQRRRTRPQFLAPTGSKPARSRGHTDGQRSLIGHRKETIIKSISATVEEHIRGDTHWAVVRANGAEWS